MFAISEEKKPEELEGLSDEHPIDLKLPVTPPKFDSLLTWFYSVHRQ
jgi:hypothetical protein